VKSASSLPKNYLPGKNVVNIDNYDSINNDIVITLIDLFVDVA